MTESLGTEYHDRCNSIHNPGMYEHHNFAVLSESILIKQTKPTNAFEYADSGNTVGKEDKYIFL